MSNAVHRRPSACSESARRARIAGRAIALFLGLYVGSFVLIMEMHNPPRPADRQRYIMFASHESQRTNELCRGAYSPMIALCEAMLDAEYICDVSGVPAGGRNIVRVLWGQLSGRVAGARDGD